MTLLSVQGVSKSYWQGDTRLEILKGLDLSLENGETLAIVGQSGSGKSTLLSLLAGLDAPDQGSIRVDGQDIVPLTEKQLAAFRAQHLGIVFQQFHLMSNLTALENVALPLEIAGEAGAMAKAAEALHRVGLSARADHFPHQLSGGECQRTAIARAVVHEPKLLLADEPSGSLDTRTGEMIMDQLFDLVKRLSVTLILVTHNEALAARCLRQTILTDGRLTRVR